MICDFGSAAEDLAQLIPNAGIPPPPQNPISEHLAVRARRPLTGAVVAQGWQTRAELRRVKLADRFVKSATTGERKSPIFTDDEVIGFGVQVRKRRKSFTLDYSVEGRRRRFYIGDFPNWSVVAARTQADREVD
jgi:hypothetical protein